MDDARMFEYDRWANREVLAALRAARNAPPSAIKTFAHIVAAEELWLARLRGETTRVAVWPERSLDETERALDAVERGWSAYLPSLTTRSSTDPVAYTNTKGERWSNTIGDVLIHAVLHSGYHRGQIASDLVRAGEAPPYTDFIHAVRQRHIG